MPDRSNSKFNHVSYLQSIKPMPDGVVRPLWSVIIPAYNCAEYLSKTLESVLEQDPGADVMQIMVVDNCSTQGDPEAVAKELGRGRVEFYRHPENIGPTRNFNACIEFSRGKLVHLLHADDYVADGFYQRMEQAFRKVPEIGAAFCRNFFVDEFGEVRRLSELEMPESGILPDKWLERLAIGCCLQTPAIVVRRKVYEELGGYDLRLAGAEDWEMWGRIAIHYPIWYETTPLAAYRVHYKSLSRSTIKSGFLAQQLYKATQMMQSHLAPTVPKQVFQISTQNCAFMALGAAEALIKEGAWKQAIERIQFALHISHSFPVIRSLLRILLLIGTSSLIKGSINSDRLQNNKSHEIS
jgi:Glycosyl transferase family 2